jgi:O-Antigen ligase
VLRLRRPATALAGALLVLGPAALGFFSGGFFEQPRLVAAVGAWLLVALAALVAERPLPRALPGRLAIAGLLLLSGWAALSLTWAPLGTPAFADVERLALYCGFLIAAAAWLRPAWVRVLVEPGLALGAVVVVGYGMSERFLPGVIQLDHSRLAFGRLEQPLTYWNAMGLLAAIGVVLCARLGGSPGRPGALRAAAAAAAPLLGGAVYLTLSRGAFAAAAVGLFVLLALGRERGQPRAVAVVAAAAAATAALAALLPDLDEAGRAASRSSGAVLLIATVALALGAAFIQLRLAASELDGRERPPETLRRWRTASLAALALVVALALVGATSPERGASNLRSQPESAQRLRSVQSDRYRYWHVALDSFVAHPLNGVGTAGFRVEWLREGGAANNVRDAHSLYLETAAELGLVGLGLLALLLGGVVASARRALAFDRTASLGPVAVLAAWAFHAGLDWDWELPAVTLPALACAGLVIALGDGHGQPRTSSLRRSRAVLTKRGS